MRISAIFFALMKSVALIMGILMILQGGVGIILGILLLIIRDIVNEWVHELSESESEEKQ